MSYVDPTLAALKKNAIYVKAMRHFGNSVQHAVKLGLGWISTAKGLYDVGRGFYTAAKVAAPIVAGLL